MPFPKSVWHWAFYDFANSAYLLIYGSFLLPVYFSTVLITHGGSLSAWGLVNGLSTLLGVALAILLGRYADRHNRFTAFRWSIIASFIGMAGLSAVISWKPAAVPLMYILANSFFILSLSLSDSILPYLATGHESYERSGFAWGFGYLGGALSLLITVVLQRFTSTFSSLVFFAVAIFYVLFSLYALSGLKSVPLNEPPPPVKISALSRKKKALLLFGYWLISESVTVIFLFISIYLSRELHLSTGGIGLLFLVVQLIAFPATWMGGKLARRGNVLMLLGLTIVSLGAALMLLILPTGKLGLAALTLLGGLSIGNSQSLLRAQYSTVIHKSESGYQFGLYSLISEGAVFIGPIFFGLASDALGSQKIPLFILFGMMVVGYVLVTRVMRKLA
ncbi:MAG: hypothetical protein RIQ56_348 [Candidatus Parcubacteria bacterium]|jgi:UMF1 family MFS transporter